MGGNSIPTRGAISVWGPHGIGKRTMGLNEIEVSRGEVAKWVPEIGNQSHALQKDLGQSDRRTDIEIDAAAIHLPHKFSEHSKIIMRRGAQSRAVGGGMKVSNVAANSHETNEGNAPFIGTANDFPPLVSPPRLQHPPTPPS